jgi:hypothetical protein
MSRPVRDGKCVIAYSLAFGTIRNLSKCCQKTFLIRFDGTIPIQSTVVKNYIYQFFPFRSDRAVPFRHDSLWGEKP